MQMPRLYERRVLQLVEFRLRRELTALRRSRSSQSRAHVHVAVQYENARRRSSLDRERVCGSGKCVLQQWHAIDVARWTVQGHPGLLTTSLAGCQVDSYFENVRRQLDAAATRPVFVTVIGHVDAAACHTSWQAFLDDLWPIRADWEM
jgi:hypothetical protein